MEHKIIQIGSSIGVVLPAQEARDEGFVLGEAVSVTRESGRFIIEKKVPVKNKSVGNPELIAWAEDAVERYRPALEALKDK
jgi:antitoxin component of MazEF toxin-antitoxin module